VTVRNQNVPSSKKEKGNLDFRLVSFIGNLGQKSEDSEQDSEVYGVSPREVGVIMLVVTILLPVGQVNVGYSWQLFPTFLYSGLWLLGLFENGFWYIANPFALFTTFWITIPLCGFNFLFIRQLNRFFQGETSRDIVLMYGLLSMTVPTFATLALWASIDFPFVITPIPIQFFVGIFLLYRFREPEVISPWSGYHLDWSWWIRQRHSIHDPHPEVINLTKMLRDHDAVWLEGYDD
jgi:hypothetical protein